MTKSEASQERKRENPVGFFFLCSSSKFHILMQFYINKCWLAGCSTSAADFHPFATRFGDASVDAWMRIRALGALWASMHEDRHLGIEESW